MLLIPLLILGIILYVIGNRVSSALIFFFFLFDGFQVVPEMLFETHLGISKSIDFAFIYILILFIYGFIKYDDYIPVNRISKLIAIYLSLIIICIGVSLFYYHINLVDILRTSRSYFLVLCYFVLRRLEKEKSDKLLKILFSIVIFQCCLFIIQAFTDIALLTGADSGGRSGIITRFYNVPLMLYFFVFYAIFNNPYIGVLKIVTTIIPSITMFLPLSRSLMMAFILSVLIGISIRIGGIKRIMKYIPLLLIIIVPILLFTAKIAGGRTITDINNVINGEFIDLDDDFVMDEESTFVFRMAHFFERFMDVTESKMGMVFGAGFMTEDSEYTYRNFDYQIGLPDENTGNTVQLDTSDISWSNFILRYGIVGSLVYLLCYMILFRSFKSIKNSLALSVILYLILLFFISFTSDLFYQLRYLVLPLVVFDFAVHSNYGEKVFSSCGDKKMFII